MFKISGLRFPGMPRCLGATAGRHRDQILRESRGDPVASAEGGVPMILREIEEGKSTPFAFSTMQHIVQRMRPSLNYQKSSPSTPADTAA
jgi:hypothetical protein